MPIEKLLMVSKQVGYKDKDHSIPYTERSKNIRRDEVEASRPGSRPECARGIGPFRLGDGQTIIPIR